MTIVKITRQGKEHDLFCERNVIKFSTNSKISSHLQCVPTNTLQNKTTTTDQHLVPSNSDDSTATTYRDVDR